MIVRADAEHLPFADRSFDMVIGSPPYEDARLYLEDGRDLGISRDCREWVEWMLKVTAEALRVSKGLVLWVVAGVTRDRCYHPAPEGLLWRWWERGGECHCLRPVIWHRNGISGSGGDQWFRADTEYVLAFKRPGPLPWADNTANGHPPKWAPGGDMSHRLSNGARVNQWGGRDTSGSQVRANGERQEGGRPSHRINEVRKVKATRRGKGRTQEEEVQLYTDPEISNPGNCLHTEGSRLVCKREPDGSMREQSYDPPDIANPGNFFHTRVGGGQMGHALAHMNEAPFPVDVPKWFVASHVPPGGIVLDPFSGSGTTVDAALSLGRRGVGCDLRQSQCLLSRKRIRTVTPGFAFSESLE